jgi:hypothetical protein
MSHVPPSCNGVAWAAAAIMGCGALLPSENLCRIFYMYFDLSAHIQAGNIALWEEVCGEAMEADCRV